MDWKNTIATIAPWLGAAIGGPLGAAAMATISNTLGLSKSTETSIKNALLGVTSEQMLAIKQADQQFAVKMQELGYQNAKDLEALAVSDRDSARRREENIRDHTNKVLAYTIVSAFVAVVCATLLGYAKIESVLAGTLIGYLSAKCEQVLSYYFGSNKSSERKTDIIANSTLNK